MCLLSILRDAVEYFLQLAVQHRPSGPDPETGESLLTFVLRSRFQHCPNNGPWVIVQDKTREPTIQWTRTSTFDHTKLLKVIAYDDPTLTMRSSSPLRMVFWLQ